jgi:subtilisin-like proprotein convertase family protein
LTSIQPSNGNLSDFVGENATGVWTLTVRDTDRGVAGTLKAWQLRICVQPTNTDLTTGTTDAYTTDLSTTGVYNTTDDATTSTTADSTTGGGVNDTSTGLSVEC